MSEQSLAAIQRVYRAAANGETSGLAWLDERVALEHRTVADPSIMGEAVSDPHWKPERYVDLHERILVRVKFSGRGSESGNEIETRIAHLWSFHRGRSTRLAVYSDWKSGLEAAGLEE